MKLDIVRIADKYAVRIRALFKENRYVSIRDFSIICTIAYAYNYCGFNTLEEAVKCLDTLKEPKQIVPEELITKARNGWK